MCYWISVFFIFNFFLLKTVCSSGSAILKQIWETFKMPCSPSEEAADLNVLPEWKRGTAEEKNVRRKGECKHQIRWIIIVCHVTLQTVVPCLQYMTQSQQGVYHFGSLSLSFQGHGLHSLTDVHTVDLSVVCRSILWKATVNLLLQFSHNSVLVNISLIEKNNLI